MRGSTVEMTRLSNRQYPAEQGKPPKPLTLIYNTLLTILSKITHSERSALAVGIRYCVIMASTKQLEENILT